jgi:hypothetical protein
VLVVVGIQDLADELMAPCEKSARRVGSRPVVLEPVGVAGAAVPEAYVGDDHVAAWADVLANDTHRLGRVAEDVSPRGEHGDGCRGQRVCQRSDIAVAKFAPVRYLRGLRCRARVRDERLEQVDAEHLQTQSRCNRDSDRPLAAAKVHDTRRWRQSKFPNDPGNPQSLPAWVSR